MIPLSGFLEQDFEIKEQPDRTYRMDTERNRIIGYVDGLQAMKQAIYKILNTERYEYVMYSWNYGIELSDLFGEPVSYVCPELQRRITEALIWDSRIQSVDGFEFDISKKGSIRVSFTVHTDVGDISAERTVNI